MVWHVAVLDDFDDDSGRVFRAEGHDREVSDIARLRIGRIIEQRVEWNVDRDAGDFQAQIRGKRDAITRVCSRRI